MKGQMGKSRLIQGARVLAFGLLLILTTGVGGCVPLRRTVNVSEQAGLAKVSRLDIAELVLEPQAHYEQRLTVTDPSVLSRLTMALDTDLPLVPLLDCPAEYRLSFVLAAGEVHEFGYYCEEWPSYLNGNQAFWSGQQVQPPAEFDAAMSELLEALPD